MSDYLKQTEHAVRNLLDLITKDRSKISELYSDLLFLEADNVEYEQDVEEFLDQEGLDPVQVARAEKYLTDSKEEIFEYNNELHILGLRQVANNVSINALSTAVLQIARQGLSITYSSNREETLLSCPNVRSICGISIQEIIWDGRNHAIHYEESPNHNAATKKLFEKLERQYGQGFSLAKNPHTSLAEALISLLGWSSYESYRRDMESLLGE
jgi:hypothetical protein